MKRICRFWRTAVLLAAVPASFSVAQTVPRTQPAPRHNDPFLSGAPFSFEQLQRLLGENAIPIRRRRDAVQARGVSFTPSPEQIEKLKAAGASDDMLKLIKSSIKSNVASLSAAPRALGGLALTCAPLECEITLNGAVLGSTQSGTMQLNEIAAGDLAIHLQKAGFILSPRTGPRKKGKKKPPFKFPLTRCQTQQTFCA